MLIGGVCEVATLGAVFPLLAALADPQATSASTPIRFLRSLGLVDAADPRWPLTVVFAGAAVASGAVRIFLIYVTARLSRAIGHELAVGIFQRSIGQPYEVHVARNSSEVVASLQKVDNVIYVLFAITNMASAFVMALCVTAALLLMDPTVAAVALFGLGGIYAAVALGSRRKIARNGSVISTAYGTRIRLVQEALGGIRDVLLGHSQRVFATQFAAVDANFRRAEAANNVLGPAPRFAVEALGMVVLAGLGYALTTRADGLTGALPMLGALALGLQRLMPMVQLVYQGFVSMRGNTPAIWDVVALARQPLPSEDPDTVLPLAFTRAIRVHDVSFAYPSHPRPVLERVTLTITKGTRLGLIGQTGSGKSTLADLLMGLLLPTGGEILIDDVPLTAATRAAWQKNLAHVPQSIFLSDASFTENIAFGVQPEEIDPERVRRAAREAQLADFIEGLPNGYATRVGERGVRLSGGQRQRIAIARALYKGANVLVFDEATSALDDETEAAVMDAVSRLGRDLTIVLIAHRLGTLKECDFVVRLKDGCVQASGTYEQVVRVSTSIVRAEIGPEAFA